MVIRALIVESAVVVQEELSNVLRSDPEIEIAGLATSAAAALSMTKRLRPDLVLMGTRLHQADAFEITKEIMIEQPTPIVLVSTASNIDDAELSVLALRAGALAVVQAPLQQDASATAEARRKLLWTIRTMSQVKVVRRWRTTTSSEEPKPLRPRTGRMKPQIVAIAASTGGPAALETILAGLPGHFPVPILVVQHISHGFVGALVSWLNRVSALKVKLAEHLEALEPHTVYVGADDKHLGVADTTRIMLADDTPIGGFRPSASYLFGSVAQHFGPAALAIILTGMGQDGVEGLRTVHAAGGRVLAQDEPSSVVFGMPRAAIEAGVTDRVLPLGEIASAVNAFALPTIGDRL